MSRSPRSSSSRAARAARFTSAASAMAASSDSGRRRPEVSPPCGIAVTKARSSPRDSHAPDSRPARRTPRAPSKMVAAVPGLAVVLRPSRRWMPSSGRPRRARSRWPATNRDGWLLVPLPLRLPRAAVPAWRALPGSGCGGLRGPGLLSLSLPGGGQPFPAAPHRRGLLRPGGTGAAHAAPGGGRDPLVVGVALGLLRGGRLLQRDLRDRDRRLLRYPARRRLPGPRLRQVGFRLLPAGRILRLARGLQVREGGRDPLFPGRPAPSLWQHRRAAKAQP